MQRPLQFSDVDTRKPEYTLTDPPDPCGAVLCESPGAIVIGGSHGSIAVARSLGRRGAPVWFFTNDQPIARFSRYVHCGPKWPDNPAGKINVLMETAVKYGLQGWTLFAGSDLEAQFLSQHHSILDACFRTTTPPWNVLRWAYDKRFTYRLAAEEIGRA